MKRLLTSFLFIGTLATADSSPSVVGAVSSQSGFTLDNVGVPAKGVASWPVVPGDIIQTSGSPVLITLSDGTEIVVDPNSKIKITTDAKGIKIVVISGSSERWNKRDGHHWCYDDSATKTSKHKCGDGDHDADDRCCPDH